MNTLSSNLNWGVNGLLIGLSTVFLVLVVLILAIALMQRLLSTGKKENAQTGIKSQVSKPAHVNEDDENEIAAVISAAVMCMAQREGKKFKIISFRKHNI